MALNVKSEQTHRLAREVATRTGESLTQAITVALRERLDRLLTGTGEAPGRRAERMRAIAAAAAPRWSAELRDTEHGDLLYDDHGLPR